MDKKLQSQTKKIFQARYDRANYFKQTYNAELSSPNTETEPYVFLSGSAVEVGMLSRSLPQKIFELEVDEMHTLGSLSKEMGEKYLKEVEGYPGYFYLSSSPSGQYLHPYFSEQLEDPDSPLHAAMETFTRGSVVDTFYVKASLEALKEPYSFQGTVSEGPSNANEGPLVDVVGGDLGQSPLIYDDIW